MIPEIWVSHSFQRQRSGNRDNITDCSVKVVIDLSNLISIPVGYTLLAEQPSVVPSNGKDRLIGESSGDNPVVFRFDVGASGGAHIFIAYMIY
jgi:hypothetical protein